MLRQLLNVPRRLWPGPGSSSEPEPLVLPEGWGEAVLRDVVAVDVERWRRFDGAIVHASEADGAHWSLTLARNPPFEPGGGGVWWRRGEAGDTVPELTGWLTVTRLADTAEHLAGSRRRMHAALTLDHGHDGQNTARLQLAGPPHWFNARQELAMELSALSPRSELDVASPPDDAAQDGKARTVWAGFPPPLSPADVRDEAPLAAVLGTTLDLGGIIDLGDEPAELLIEAERPDEPGELLLRVSAAEPLDAAFPDLNEPSEWNRADACESVEDVAECTLTGDELRLAGHQWRVVVAGPGLRVRVEVVG